MIDIDAEFRKAIYGTTTANAASSDEPLTIEKLHEAMQKLGPPPPHAHLSKYAPALGDARPTSVPQTGDMQQMMDDIGPQRVPVAYRLSSQFGDMVVINPVNVREES